MNRLLLRVRRAGPAVVGLVGWVLGCTSARDPSVLKRNPPAAQTLSTASTSHANAASKLEPKVDSSAASRAPSNTAPSNTAPSNTAPWNAAASTPPCSSSRDCAGGAWCCHDGHDGTRNHCASECTYHEACVSGVNETCHPGSRCNAEPGSQTGNCVVAEPGTACGELRCSGAKPGCRFDLRADNGVCLALDHGGWPSVAFENVESSALLQCASPKDCAGERCCIGGPFPMTSCSGECASGIDVCDSIADCPEFVGPPIGCKPDPDGPAFVKLCQYAWPAQ